MVVNMTNNDTIMLRHYVPQDYSMLEAFQLSESDLKFVKTPEENITAAMSDNERYPIVNGWQAMCGLLHYIVEKGRTI